jgi:hypothetical protein
MSSSTAKYRKQNRCPPSKANAGNPNANRRNTPRLRLVLESPSMANHPLVSWDMLANGRGFAPLSSDAKKKERTILADVLENTWKMVVESRVCKNHDIKKTLASLYPARVFVAVGGTGLEPATSTV